METSFIKETKKNLYKRAETAQEQLVDLMLTEILGKNPSQDNITVSNILRAALAAKLEQEDRAMAHITHKLELIPNNQQMWAELPKSVYKPTPPDARGAGLLPLDVSDELRSLVVQKRIDRHNKNIWEKYNLISILNTGEEISEEDV